MRVLAVVYCYPPLLVPAAICYMKTLMGLQRSGADIEILHIDPDTFESPTGFVQLDPELAALSPDEFVTHSIRSLETTPWVKLAKRLDPSRRLTYRWLEPKKREWTYPALRWLAKEDLSRFDVLLTCSQPHTNHLLGLQIKRRTGLPWVAYFSDPWTDSPYIHYRSERVRGFNRRLEDEILREADHVLYTCEEMRQLILDQHPSLDPSRSGVLPHAFVPEWYDRPTQHARAETNSPSEPRLELLHTGSFYGPRSPQPLIESIQRLTARLGSPPDLRVDIYGGMGSEHQRAIADAGLTDRILLHGMIPYLETLQLMRSSDGLLLVDAPLSSTAESVFLPSKLIDYLGAGTPILAITPEEGATARVVRETGGQVCPLERADALDEALVEALARGRVFNEHRPEAVARFGCGRVGQDLRAVVDGIVKPGQ